MASASGPQGLIDTDILIDAERAVPQAVTFLAQQLTATGVQISIVSAMELIAGCRNAKELVVVRQFLQSVTVLPLDAQSSQVGHQLMDAYFLSHGLLIPDALIAATALANGLTLYTKTSSTFR